MVLGLSISTTRKILLVFIEIAIKILWVIDKITSLDLRYIFKTIFRSFLLFIPISFFVFLGYSYSTEYLHNTAVAILVPDFISTGQNEVIVYPKLVGSFPAPEITAKSAVAIERGKGRMLFEKSPYEKLAPASTVKLMTALVALDIYDVEEVLEVPEICTQVEGTKAWFPAESKFKVKDLIESMLIGSAGDSSCVLANSKISEKEFVDKMNEKAVEIGMSSTYFSNPIGLDNVNGGHYSSAYDLYLLSVYATDVLEIKEAVSKKDFILSSIGEDYKVYLPNTNRLLREVNNSIGIKTGTTLGAGEVLIYEYADDVKDIIIVVMGSKDRFNDTKEVLYWLDRSYSWN
ncbi:hypothetical protein K0B04_00775 [Patescibacteria group bacterium]|nr:hypothetical protein [Patescibacteria group bacterium]